MKIARSGVTAQGRVTVPTDVRRKLGLTPGSFLEWHESEGIITVRRKRKVTTEMIHRELFPEGPPKKLSLSELKEGIRERMRRRYNRD